MNDIDKPFCIELINKIIKHAIYYGGDSGGAYYIEEEKGPLHDAMERFRLSELGDNFAIGFIHNVPMFFEKYNKGENNG